MVSKKSELERSNYSRYLDETTLLPNRFHLHVDRTIKNLEEQEATNGNFQITIEDNGPKVSLLDSRS